ncbi:LPXTG cell wall anchor domain-containing protein, partial [Streptomyces sp. NPDC059466]|uniref:LPXTG cell wall anchor domain-containing protein n=1 Tax=Streptomyces sp. NPDC059466 TaxID=3346843 RepID=UPI0036ACF416
YLVPPGPARPAGGWAATWTAATDVAGTTATGTTAADTTADRSERAATEQGDDPTRLADTGSVNTTPYVVGGTLFLGLGAGFVTYSVRRERTAAF